MDMKYSVLAAFFAVFILLMPVLSFSDKLEYCDDCFSEMKLPPLQEGGDVEYVPLWYKQQTPPGMIASMPYGANYYDTSEYMIGSVAVGIILPESNGAYEPETEDWDQPYDRTSEVYNKVNVALDWWESRAAFHGVQLSFDYIELNVVETGYEPISHAHTDDYLWIIDTMNNFGYPGSTELDGAYAYANYLRDAHDTDWAFVIFVADSLNDADGFFADGVYAYAKFGGPYFVMNYKNGFFGPAFMQHPTGHEIGHIFYALDEYAESGCTCTFISGYLAADNQNCENGCLRNEINIMKTAVFVGPQIDTREQIGWVDSDSDYIPDIMDTTPDLTMSDAEFLNPHTVRYTGSIWENPLPNQNPHGSGNSISINTVEVWYRNNGNPWSLAMSDDGAFDSGLEGYSFIVPLFGGENFIEAKGENSAGNSMILNDSVFREGGGGSPLVMKFRTSEVCHGILCSDR